MSNGKHGRGNRLKNALVAAKLTPSEPIWFYRLFRESGMIL
jgi:hypothetical protein